MRNTARVVVGSLYALFGAGYLAAGVGVLLVNTGVLPVSVNDAIAGQGGNDVLYGGMHDDVLSGGTGTDVLYGEQGTDWLIGGNSEADNNDGTRDTLNGDRYYDGVGYANDATGDVYVISGNTAAWGDNVEGYDYAMGDRVRWTG